MSDIQIKLEGMDELRKNLRKIDSSIRSTVAVKAVTEGAYQIADRARMNAPVKKSTLKNSMAVSTKAVHGGAEAEILFQTPYARIQEFGGTIYPRKGKYLKFRVNGKWVNAKQVKIRGKHYLNNAIESEKDAAVDAMAKTIKDYLGE